MDDWGVVCLLAAYCRQNSPSAPVLGSHCVRRGTTVSANQLPLPRL